LIQVKAESFPSIRYYKVPPTPTGRRLLPGPAAFFLATRGQSISGQNALEAPIKQLLHAGTVEIVRALNVITRTGPRKSPARTAIATSSSNLE
jgi:hypothetical protein